MVPETVRYSFYAGAAVLLLSMLWTVANSREYPPQRLAAFADSTPLTETPIDARKARRSGALWALAGVALALLIGLFALKPEVYLLAAGVLAYGLALLWLARRHGARGGAQAAHGAAAQILGDLYTMPEAMRRLAWVQFFSWFALFAMWIYTTPAVTAVQFHSSVPTSAAYNAGANWVGILFGAYNGVAALAAVLIPFMARVLGLRRTHLINLWLGAAGLLSITLIGNPHWLLLSMVGVGIAWASILALPYALLSDHVPAQKMGVYMGIFNFFIVIPQLLAASVLGLLLKTFFGDRPMGALVLGALSLFIAGLAVLRVQEPARAALRSAAASRA